MLRTTQTTPAEETRSGEASYTAPLTAGETPTVTAPIEGKRVRPEELAAALSAIEARRTAAMNSTVVLQEALSELQIDATPEEVWQEIETRRKAEETATQAKVQKKRRRTIQGAVIAASLLGIALAVRSVVVDATTLYPAPVPRQAVQQTPVRAYAQPLNLTTLTPSMRPLGQIRNGTTFPVDGSMIMDLRRALYGTGMQQPLPKSEQDLILIDTNPPYRNARRTWMVLKDNDKLYLRAWTLKKLPLETLKSQRLTYHNVPGDNPAVQDVYVPITIPLDGISNNYSMMSSSSAGSRLEVQIEKLDNNAWDRFPYRPGDYNPTSPNSPTYLTRPSRYLDDGGRGTAVVQSLPNNPPGPR